jgi:pimeloyl-ACP methyl ester carboxylesterase
VFIHGLGCSKEAYGAAWEQEVLKDYSLLSFDILGFGASPKPLDFPYTLEAHAELLAQILNQYSQYRIHFIANSWGPLIGLQLPGELLSSLASFVNIEGRMVIEDVGNAKKAASVSFAEFEQSFFPEIKSKYAGDPKTAYKLDEALPQAYYRGARSIVETVSRGTLPDQFVSLSCPTLYMYGDQNSQLKSLTVIPGVPTIEISRAGHFMMKENPAEFYATLSEFLKPV